MSLKAKLEAVIYAAEEPVTLAQLSALFADEAFQWKAEQEAASAEEAAEAARPLPLESGEFAYLGTEADTGEPASPMQGNAAAGEQTSETQAETVTEAESEAGAEPVAEAGAKPNPEIGSTEEAASQSATEEPPAEAVEDPAAIEAEAKRQARQREREARAIIRQLLDELISACALDDCGVEIREIAGGYHMATKPECHDAVRLFVRSLKPALKLSMPALETLAVVAYKQPVTAPEVNEIRGVDSSGVFGSLLARKLIATAGRKPVIGRPILYKTTREFLLRFGLKDVSELPSMEEFEKMAASELEEPEPTSGEYSEQEPKPAPGSEFDETASEELEDSPAEGTEARTEATEPTKTAATAVSNEPTNPAEAAPADSSPTEQAETEKLPNGEENKQDQEDK
jgi:segregation and condensation protein B